MGVVIHIEEAIKAMDAPRMMDVKMTMHCFDFEVRIDEVAVQGESGSGEKFYDAEYEIQEPAAVVEEVSAVAAQASAQQKETTPSGVDPSGPSGRISDSVMNKMQAEFERARVNRFQAGLEKAQAENARFLALLQQAQTKPKS
ncbi:hypothetical protein Dimus_035962 [Dionaea muscipula]